MDKKERLNAAFKYLRNQGLAETQKEVAEKMGSTAPNVSSAMRGVDTVLTDKFLLRFNAAFGNIFSDSWLTTGEGEMLAGVKAPAETKEDTRPRIPVAAAAGTLAGFAAAVKAEDCEMVPVIKAFPSYDYTMIVKGNSMEPKYEGGDEIAIRRVSSTIEWGKTYVLDTRDGAVIKRLYDAGDQFRCVSYNSEYPDFYVDKSEVFGVYKVVGLIRI